MFEIRKIQRKDFEKAAYIKSIAFHSDMPLYEGIEKAILSFKETEKAADSDVFICKNENEIAGLITVSRFCMNFHGVFIDVYALSGVSVHINYRKTGVADKMIRFFLNYAIDKGAGMVMLYPYRPSFYKKYGFGWGMEKYEYTVNTADFKFVNNKNIIPFMPGNIEHIRKIHDEYAKMRHGMCLINDIEWSNFEKDIGDEDIVLIKNDEGNYEGYAVVRFEKDPQYNPYDQMIIIERLIVQSAQAQECFISFVHTLKDQFQTTKAYTHNEYFYYNLSNTGSIYNSVIPAGYHHSCRRGLGIMYKALDAQRLLDTISSKDVKSGYCFLISDKYNNSSKKVYLGDSKSSRLINISIEDFTSWIMGCIPAVDLHRCGLLVSDKNTAEELDKEVRLLKPICTSAF